MTGSRLFAALALSALGVVARGGGGGTLSGGEQQMLAMARALMSRPRFL